MLNTYERIARLHDLQDKINALAELEPRLVNDTDWHSNSDAITQMINIIEEEETHNLKLLSDEALNVAVKYMQDKLGVTDGDRAGQFFSDGLVAQEFFDYMLYEMEEK
jgi:predicted Abi (CAAX) family protease